MPTKFVGEEQLVKAMGRTKLLTEAASEVAVERALAEMMESTEEEKKELMRLVADGAKDWMKTAIETYDKILKESLGIKIAPQE